jgi:hypothetical protein
MRKPELRPNNLVGMQLDVFPHNIFTVSEVGDTMKVYDQEIHYFDVDDLEGIPLTEEWLKKLGFRKSAAYQIHLRDNLFLTVDLPIKGSSRKSSDICITWDYTGRWITGHILCVHELQNLYYTLTGNELTIKP